LSTRVLLKRMRESNFFVVGLTVALLIVLAVVFASAITGFDPRANSLPEKFTPPDWLFKGLGGHVFGTDQLGRDVFSRLLYGGKASLTIAFWVVLLQIVIGSVLGIVSGYFGGAVDACIMRSCDIMLSLPNLILAIAIMAVLGASMFNLIFVLTITGWVQFTKVTRNDVMIVKSREFVHASKALGGRSFYIMFRQIFPNVTTNIIISASQRVGMTILLESSLSFLNLGVPPPEPSWGNMIAAGRQYLTICPWMALAPGVALMLAVLGFNFLGDGLRDVLDPKRS